jgi:hypothetical protein
MYIKLECLIYGKRPGNFYGWEAKLLVEKIKVIDGGSRYVTTPLSLFWPASCPYSRVAADLELLGVKTKTDMSVEEVFVHSREATNQPVECSTCDSCLARQVCFFAGDSRNVNGVCLAEDDIPEDKAWSLRVFDRRFPQPGRMDPQSSKQARKLGSKLVDDVFGW